MSHLFCHSCGTKISYGHAKPNFCGKCGQQLNASASANVAGETSTVEKSVILSNDETDASFVPKLTNFEVDYEVEKKAMTLGSLIGEDAQPDKKERKRSQSINEFIDEKKKER
jgi:hypothetical protein|tara:strand:+ start:2106 stop:2444 length:339 start_codon:yes stop_codon:yes gene_type:complete